MKRNTLGICVLLLCSIGFRPASAQEEARTLILTTGSDEAKAHFRQGLTDQENIFPDRAAKHYEQALESDPGFAMAKFMLAATKPGLTREGRLEKMDEALADLVNASPGEMLLALAWREDLRGEDDAAVRALYDAAVSIMPDDPHLALRRALATEAIYTPASFIALSEVVERFPEAAAAHNMLAYTRWHLGDKAGAIESVDKYVALMPHHPNAHDSYAELMQFRGMYGEAIKHYRKAVELDREYVNGYLGLADVSILKGDPAAARGHLKKARDVAASASQIAGLDRSEALTYFHEGNAGTGLKKLRAAAEAADAAGQKVHAAQTYRVLAAAEALTGDKSRVEADLAKAAELGGGDTPAHLAWAAYAYAMAGDADAAHRYASAYDKVSGGDRNWGPTMHGLAYLAAGDLQSAEKQFVLSGTANVASRAAMARVQRMLGRTAEAEFYEREALSDNSLGVGDSPFALNRYSMRKN